MLALMPSASGMFGLLVVELCLDLLPHYPTPVVMADLLSLLHLEAGEVTWLPYKQKTTAKGKQDSYAVRY